MKPLEWNTYLKVISHYEASPSAFLKRLFDLNRDYVSELFVTDEKNLISLKGRKFKSSLKIASIKPRRWKLSRGGFSAYRRNIKKLTMFNFNRKKK